MSAHVVRNAAGPDVAWRDGRLVDPRTIGPDVIEIDAGGATVLPGFIDAHHHAGLAALYGGAQPLVAPAVTDIASLQAAVAAAAASSASEWVVVSEWNEERLAERRPPTRAELDEAAPGRPVFAMHYSCHRAVVSSKALEILGIDRHTPDPFGGVIERGRGGVPNGLLLERAMADAEGRARASLVATDAEGFLSRLSRHYRDIARAGITHVIDAMVPEDMAVLWEEADRRGAVIVPTTIMPAAARGGYFDPPFTALDGRPTGESRGNLRIGPMKLVFDGAPVCAMCMSWWQAGGVMLSALAMTLRQRSWDTLRTSMSVKPTLGRELRSGIMLYDPSLARKITEEARARGFDLAIHATGNAAAELAIDSFAQLEGRAGRARIEHGTFLDREQIRRVADLGVAIVTQPPFLRLPTIAHAPPIPGLPYLPLRWLLDAKVTVGASSDFPVTAFDPLAGIRAAVERRTMLEELHEPEQRIELDEAVALYTSGAAKAAGCFDERGSLDPGKRADVVILDQALTPESLDRVRVKRTFIGGVEI
ncbi:MAG: amidohydrolase [Labilithrix sp.]